MIDKAFVVNHGSEFEEKYFKAVNQKTKFTILARAFLEKYRLKEVRLESQLYARFYKDTDPGVVKQFCKRPDKHGFCTARKRSKIGEEWVNKISSTVDISSIDFLRMWALPYVKGFSLEHTLWDNGEGLVYGLLGTPDGVFSLPEDSYEIPLSDYYLEIERIEKLRNNR